MPSIEHLEFYGYRNADQYWDVVKVTLEKIFQASPAHADILRQTMERRPHAEQLLFYHAEPLDVASDIAGKLPRPEQIQKYHDLSREWKT